MSCYSRSALYKQPLSSKRYDAALTSQRDLSRIPKKSASSEIFRGAGDFYNRGLQGSWAHGQPRHRIPLRPSREMSLRAGCSPQKEVMCAEWCVVCRAEAINGDDAMRHADVSPQEP
jgi:hypothetical protein